MLPPLVTSGSSPHCHLRIGAVLRTSEAESGLLRDVLPPLSGWWHWANKHTVCVGAWTQGERMAGSAIPPP